MPFHFLQFGMKKPWPGGCIMHLDNETDLFVPHPLRKYEQRFADFAFSRCHPLIVMNLRKIDEIKPGG